MRLNKKWLERHDDAGNRLDDIWIHPGVKRGGLPEITRPDLALRVIDWVQTYCCHTKGKWMGQPFRLLPWQFYALWEAYGQCDENGLRVYRFVYIQIPKKNGKTELGAALSDYHLCADGENGAEVYPCARDRIQAGVLFKMAAYMARKNPALAGRLKVLESTHRITYAETNSYLAVMSKDSKNKSGPSPSFIPFDELHEADEALWRIMTYGTDTARQQQLVWVMTTAGVYEKESIYNRQKLHALAVARDPSMDPAFLPILYLPPDEIDFDTISKKDMKKWIKEVNPAIPHLFSFDLLWKEFLKAKKSPDQTLWLDFLRFRLNVDISNVLKFMDMRHWGKCGGEIDEEALRGRTCFMAIDPSVSKDLSAVVLVFPPKEEGEKWKVVCRFYCPKDSIVERTKTDRVPYQIWANQEHITATPGQITDHGFIIDEVVELCEKFNVHEIGFDFNKGEYMGTTLLNTHGLPVVKVVNSPANMNGPLHDIQAKAEACQINHGNHPILSWNWENTVAVVNRDKLIRIDKSKNVERIDGAVAMATAWNRALAAVEEKNGWEDAPDRVITI